MQSIPFHTIRTHSVLSPRFGNHTIQLVGRLGIQLPQFQVTEYDAPPEFNNADLVKLVKQNPELKNLDLSHTQVTDLEPLRALQSLERLVLNNLNLNRLEPLSGLNRLKYLHLSHARSNSPEIDLQPLYGLSELQIVYLNGAKVSPAAVERVKLALPNLQVFT